MVLEVNQEQHWSMPQHGGTKEAPNVISGPCWGTFPLIVGTKRGPSCLDCGPQGALDPFLTEVFKAMLGL